MTFCLAFFLAFFLTYILTTFCLAFYPASSLTYILTFCLARVRVQVWPTASGAGGGVPTAVTDTASNPPVAKSNPPVPPVTTQTIAPLDRRPPHCSIRPWTGAEDPELMAYKNDTRSRPSWKTIGLRLRRGRDPDVCKLWWQILKQTMPDANPRNEPEAED